ncbi:MAG: hypothetical protein L0H93_08305 [Nocardioides sp.]|nr:hypothetical protein [Nocardioides sp.]
MTKDSEWITREGDIVLRKEIHALYGGGLLRGIRPSTTSPNVLLFTEERPAKEQGHSHEGWDISKPRVFYFTGEGKDGDQQMTGGNLAGLEHAANATTLRLFQAWNRGPQAGGQKHRYLGAFVVDTEAPFRHEIAVDKQGNERKVIVFTLIRQ